MRKMVRRAVLQGKASPMTVELTPAIRSEAIAWHIGLRAGHAQDWDDFVEWLARDPSHSVAYDAVSLDDAALDQTLINWSQSAVARTNDNQPMATGPNVSRRWLVGGMTAAAGAAALVFIVPPAAQKHDFYDVETVAGRQQVVMLAGNDRVALNGSTRVRLDRHNPRFASLLSGEAAFSIVHDPKAPFELIIGNARVRDAGTAFNVVRTPNGHKVEVSEGSILYNPAAEHIALAAGQTLTSNTRERRITLARKPISEVGGWQRGRLSYRSATLADVAADLSRSIGTPIVVQPAIAGRSFTGTIEIDRDERRMFARLGPLLDVDARRGAGGWTFGPVRKTSR